ncbi:hypothetical protein RN001_005351 [Aquatica leii]|uniref:Uncharacterized protein n=1 Tax=Aquatica leii TaxID=1421715 RepID=A0AAN7SHU3_9COLE|nr:hypothetical protein RN001_005351 [Aquatica leii]
MVKWGVVESLLNCVENESTGFTPHELMKGDRPTQLIESLIPFPIRKDFEHRIKILLARENFKSAARKRKAKHDTKIKAVKFKPGTLVLAKTHNQSSSFDKTIKKFFHLYEGPYVVIKEVGVNAYVLNEPDTNRYWGTQNVENLRPYFT